MKPKEKGRTLLEAMAVAKLIPLLDVEENDQRPTLRIFPDEYVVVGRNNTTMIELPHISRELLKLEWKNSALLATPLVENHYIQINNQVINQPTVIQHGEILSLCREQLPYQARYIHNATRSSELSSGAKRKFTDHVSCPVCMELLVDTTMLVPCGHRFCSGCCPRDECASCRSKIQSHVADKLFDSFISDLVSEQCLDADDTEAYKQRTEKMSRAAMPNSNDNAFVTPKRQRMNPPSPTKSEDDKHEVIVLT